MSGQIEKRSNEGVLSLALARPEKKNALTGAMYDALTAGLTEASKDDGVGLRGRCHVRTCCLED